MSLVGTAQNLDIARFPRVSGDEPSTGQQLCRHQMFSPRERG